MEELQHQKKENRKNLSNKGLRDFTRYSGLAFQMVAVILLAVWGGKKLDEISEFKKPVFTIILSLVGVFAAIYTAVKDFLKKP